MAKFRATDFTWQFAGPQTSIREEAAAGQVRCMRPVHILDATPAKRVQARRDFLGYQFVASVAKGGGGTIRYITRQTPMPYPAPAPVVPVGVKDPPAVLPPAEPLYVSGVLGSSGYGVGTETLEGTTWPEYEANLVFTPRIYRVREDSDVKAASGPLYDSANLVGYPDEGLALAGGWKNTRYIEKQIAKWSQLVEIREGQLRFVDDAVEANRTPIGRGFPVPITGARYRYIWHLVPIDGIPEAAINATLNRVNNATFDGCAAGTLLLDTYAIDIQPDALGFLAATVTYDMVYKPNKKRASNGGQTLGWNSMLRTTGGTFDFTAISANGLSTGNPPFASVDFAALFRPDQ